MAFRRIHALTNTFSGVAAEARAAAEFVRCGLRVAKPYWTDDEVDLLVLMKEQGQAVVLPIQVKSVQFLPSASRKWNTPRYLQGLKKKYVVRNPALSVLIYRPDNDRMWFIDGADNIIAAYNSTRTSPPTTEEPFSSLKPDDDVAITVSETDAAFDAKWLVPSNDGAWLGTKFSGLAKKIVDQNRLTAQMEALWSTTDPVSESDLDADQDSETQGAPLPVVQPAASGDTKQ